MKLEGMHHITMITSGAVKNVEFYADVLGLRMIKKTINFDAPDAYHLYFGDEHDLPSQHERLRPLLEGGGINVSYHESDAAHEIDRDHLAAAIDWLSMVITPTTTRA